MAKAWYYFMGDQDYNDTTMYYRVNVKHQCLCGDKICAIYVDDNGQHPAAPLSQNMQLYIINAMATGQLQPENPIAKKFVYLREKH